MNAGNEIILIAGVLSLLAVLAGLASARIGTPLLLSLIGVGMLAGEDGPGGIPFNNFQGAYLIGSVALAIILFQGGLNTQRGMLRRAFWPAAILATVGVAISAGVVGAAAVALFGLSWPEGLLLGAVTAPTDAAAVSVLLRVSRIAVPSRVIAALEVESGLNDPMSVLLTLVLVGLMTRGSHSGPGDVALLFLEEMGGGAAIGLASGFVLLKTLRWLRPASSVRPLLALGGALTVFGGAQVLGESGFLAAYLAGVVIGNADDSEADSIVRFFDTFGWLAQNALFLMLGLLVTPHKLPPLLLPAFAISVILILLARPIAVAACLAPFRWTVPESAFIAWAGLRGGVPIYLTIIPLLAGVPAGQRLFEVVFVIVIVSVAVQGWTAKRFARLLHLREDAAS